MKEISKNQISDINGGFLNFIIGTAIGLISYSINKHKNNEPMTISGATTAASFGAVTGGLGGAAVGAAGGGIVGNIAWRPGFVAINAAGQAIASDK